MKIAVAGASGFVGKHLVKILGNTHEVIGLTRSNRKKLIPGVSEWIQADFFSLSESEKALENIDIAFYLVHSMLPKAELAQGNFSDFDAIVADNFARACKKNNVKRIIYLSGIIPNTTQLSHHLESRLEVEKILSNHQVPVTTLRAGLILGHGGSSFEMMYRLVKNLRIMICPSWTQTTSQPIHIDDVIDCLYYCLNNPDKTNDKSFDIGGKDILTYTELMKGLANELKRSLQTFSIKFFTPKLSILWVKLITGASSELISPLVESLKHNMVASNLDLQLNLMQKTPKSYIESIREILKEKKKSNIGYRLHQPLKIKENKTVQSVQRFSKPKTETAFSIGKAYLRWLPLFLKFILRADLINENECVFFLRFFSIKLLGLKIIKSRSTPDRVVYNITSGLLARGGYIERFEFRSILNHEVIIAAIHDFRPRLPWYIYKWTQAIFHLWVMKKFDYYLCHLYKKK